MNVLYELEEATAKEIQQRLPNKLTYSAVRAVLSRLVDQGHLRYRASGPRYVYTVASARKKLRQGALQRVVDTFFGGSPLRTMNALLDVSRDDLSLEEIEHLTKIIAKAEEKSK